MIPVRADSPPLSKEMIGDRAQCGSRDAGTNQPVAVTFFEGKLPLRVPSLKM